MPPAPPLAEKEGTVEVGVRLRAAPDTVWAALTDPLNFGQWFGDLAAPLQPGSPTSITFGDGDMFAVENVRLAPPHRLAYDWRFHGIGPLDSITWQILPRADGCRLVVTDRETARTPEAVLRMRTGWLDFLGRLQHFLTTGQRARYDWSHEIEASVECDADVVTAWQRLVQPPHVPGWLAALDGPEPGHDRAAGRPAAWTSETVAGATWAPFQLDLRFAEPGWLAPTRCRLMAEERHTGTLLTLYHAGWEAVSNDLNVAREQRRLYCARWIAALQDARRVAEIGEPDAVP
jgi:uncharacterized protein YndB with AHSA1/START domain